MSTATTYSPAAKQALERRTRRPSGKPSWPILLIAGAEKAGKSWACAQASASDLIGRTLWIGIGEDDPDEYGNVPGADFEIVEHDGTFRDILAAVDWAVAQEPVEGKPNLIVVDSMTRLWDLLCDLAQGQAKTRTARKAANSKQTAPADDEVQITMDLWNIAKDRWGHVIDSLREHQGPTLLTARLEEVVVVVNGKPTNDRALKVKTEKSLPYDVGGIVQLPERGRAFLTGVRTTRIQVPERIPLPGFTVDKLWRDLGLADSEIGERHHQGVVKAPGEGQPAATVRQMRSVVDTKAEAFTVAQAAAKSAKVEDLRAMWLDAQAKGLHDVDVTDALTAAEIATAGLAAPVSLKTWLETCATYVGKSGGVSVADTVALDSAANPETI